MKNDDGMMWRKHDLRERYDVVVIGAGVHGLATAYYLGKKGITRVAVLDKGYLGGGNSGRNTAILRANYRTVEGIPFYWESLRLYEELSKELNYNLLFAQMGHLTLAHTDSSVNSLRIRAELNSYLGVPCRLIDANELKRMVPTIDITNRPRYPIMAALYNPPGGTIRHDPVMWGYARACDRMGIEIHPHTEATGIETTGDEVTAVQTNRGRMGTRNVVNATAGWASSVSKMAGIDLPLVTHPLQACVTEPLKPFLDKVIVSANLHIYIHQTDRGELVIGAEIDPYSSYSTRSTLNFLEVMSAYTLELFPFLKDVKVLRQWGGSCEMTPDFSPIIGGVSSLKGFYLDVGWGTYGFKAGPAAGKNLAELIATGKTPEMIEPFELSRFYEGRVVGEKAAAAVSH